MKDWSPSLEQAHSHYAMVARVIEYLVEHHTLQPSLAELAAFVGVGEHHLQRVFSQWAGVSPKQFLKCLTVEYAKGQLQRLPVLESALASGLSGSGRLHDLFISCESVTPGEYKSGGRGLTIEYGSAPTPFGFGFVARCERGVCKLAFFDEPVVLPRLYSELKKSWPNATLINNPLAGTEVCNTIFQSVKNNVNDTGSAVHGAGAGSIHLLLKGTPFRLQVWQALLALPEGHLTSYQQVAESMGRPNSVRAVASAIANNDIGLLIPCHRVIRSTGALSEYRWGKVRKQALIGWEHTLGAAVDKRF